MALHLKATFHFSDMEPPKPPRKSQKNTPNRLVALSRQHPPPVDTTEGLFCRRRADRRDVNSGPAIFKINL